MSEFDLSEVETDDLISELKERDAVGEIDTDALVEALQDKHGVETMETSSKYKNYVVAIEDGNIHKDTGKVIILIVEA